MSARITSIDGPRVTLTVSGTLTQAELAAAQAEVARLIPRLGRINILVLAEDFQGWEKGGEWNDFSFQQANDDYIERMAVVGEEQWRDLTLLFTSQGLRPFPIEYFVSGAEARAWLQWK